MFFPRCHHCTLFYFQYFYYVLDKKMEFFMLIQFRLFDGFGRPSKKIALTLGKIPLIQIKSGQSGFAKVKPINAP